MQAVDFESQLDFEGTQASVIMLTIGSDTGRQAETAKSARGNGGALLVTQTANWLWATTHHGVRHKP